MRRTISLSLITALHSRSRATRILLGIELDLDAAPTGNQRPRPHDTTHDRRREPSRHPAGAVTTLVGNARRQGRGDPETALASTASADACVGPHDDAGRSAA